MSTMILLCFWECSFLACLKLDFSFLISVSFGVILAQLAADYLEIGEFGQSEAG